MSERRKGKKLINDPEDCVDENLEGFSLVNTGIRKVKGHRIMVREDYKDLVTHGKVSVLSGGGSGHEPQESGFVGRGMLTCCVMGSIFAAPPSQQLLLAIRLVAKDNPAGCLLIIANYTGDKLNFGVAMEKAKQEGIKVDFVIVGEDCAMVSSRKSAGRRGLVGFILAYKLAGALSEEGRSLEDMVAILNEKINNMGSIGLSLTACTVPGSSATFHVAEYEMELGLGVHGEPGVETLKFTTAKETVKIMLDHMTCLDNPNRISLNKDERVLCVLNNLGGTTNLEMNILSREVVTRLKDNFNVNIERILCGSLNTSQEMSGVIITILKLDDVTLRLIDAPTLAPCWPRPLLSVFSESERLPIEIEAEPEKLPEDDGVVFQTQGMLSGLLEEIDIMYEIIVGICHTLVLAESLLNTLDTEGGDGDCGTTLCKGAKVLLDNIGQKDNPGLPIKCPYKLALKLANIAENHMGGSTGALYSIFLTSGATALRENITRQAWSDALQQGIDTIKRFGGAEEGDRTMLDPLCAVNGVLRNEIKNTDVLTVYKQITHAVEEKTKETANMKARAGRASYVSSDRLKQPDPGATAVCIWIRAIVETLEKFI